MSIRLVIPPAPILTVHTAKRHLLYDDNDQDELIESLIQVATRHIDGNEGWLHRSLNPQTYDLVYDSFPCGAIRIPLPPLISIDAVNYIDENGMEQVVDSASYVVDNVGEPAWVQLGSSLSWPSIMNTINAVRVRFTAGYAFASGDETTVPFPIRHAILMMVADLFQHRESVSNDGFASIPIPSTVKALLHPYRVFD